MSLNPIQIDKTLSKAYLPRPIRHKAVVALKRLLAPGAVDARRAAVRNVPVPSDFDIDDLRRNGAGLFPVAGFPEALAATRKTQEIVESLRQARQLKTSDRARKGKFLVTLCRGSDLLAAPDVMTFALSDTLLGVASHYFGEVPVLSELCLWWSPSNDSHEESQCYHYDGEDRTQLKLFLHISDVDERSGPFTYLDSETSKKIPATKRLSARLTDDLVHKHVGTDAAKRFLGPAGSLAIVDTSRCLHYGSRGNSVERLVMMIQFTRFLAPKAAMPRWNLPETDLARLSKVQRMVLNLPT